MVLRPIGDDGAVSGTGTLICSTRIVGGILISADGTNAATVIVRKNNAFGAQVFDMVTKAPVFVAAPFALGSTQILHYDVSGTGAAAQFFEWVE